MERISLLLLYPLLTSLMLVHLFRFHIVRCHCVWWCNRTPTAAYENVKKCFCDKYNAWKRIFLHCEMNVSLQRINVKINAFPCNYCLPSHLIVFPRFSSFSYYSQIHLLPVRCSALCAQNNAKTLWRKNNAAKVKISWLHFLCLFLYSSTEVFALLHNTMYVSVYVPAGGYFIYITTKKYFINKCLLKPAVIFCCYSLEKRP